jgi:hypothetical protein
VLRHPSKGGVKPPQRDPGIGGGELPTGFHGGLIAAGRPGGPVAFRVGPFADPLGQVAGRGAQFNLGPVQPTAVFRRVVNLKPFGERRASSGEKAS